MTNIKKMKTRRPKSEGGNLKTIDSSEMAREYQRRGVEARRKNQARRNALKEFVQDMKHIGEDVGDHAPKGLDVLRFLMVQAMEAEDYDLAGQYAEKIAQYETPKKAAQQIDITTTDLTDLTDEELQAAIAEMEKEDED